LTRPLASATFRLPPIAPYLALAAQVASRSLQLRRVARHPRDGFGGAVLRGHGVVGHEESMNSWARHVLLS
jgi:hypothetical protein